MLIKCSVIAPRLCCLDLDTFFVSVERLFDAGLRGKPVIIGGRPGERGVVTACSYEAREFGVRSGMSLTQAARLAPRATYIRGTHDRYAPYSRRVREIAERFTPSVQMASIDEMYLDFAGCENLYRRGSTATDDDVIHGVVRELTHAIQQELGLPASAGIAASKRMAKVACGLAKPAGVMLVPAGAERAVLSPLPVRKLPGVGPVAEAKLHALGVSTLGELAATPLVRLRTVFGAWAESVHLASVGQGARQLSGDRPAFFEHDVVGGTHGSLSNERTFREDVSDPSVIDNVLCALTERVCHRARKRGVKARTITLKLRYTDFHTISRGQSLLPANSEFELFPVVKGIYRRARRRNVPIRLLGLQLSRLTLADTQLSLFETAESLSAGVDDIKRRFGFDAIRLATGRGRSVGTRTG